MAEHRRVESRGIVGTGMASDPDRIRELDDEKARKERAWRDAPEKGFGDVLKDAPARGELADDDGDPRNHKRPRDGAAEAAMAAAAIEPGGASASSTPAVGAPSTPAPSAPPATALPRVPRDPREAMLRKKLEAAQRAPKPVLTGDTPPTGSHARKPT